MDAIDPGQLRVLAKTVLYRASRDLSDRDNLDEYNEAFEDYYGCLGPAALLALLDALKIQSLVLDELARDGNVKAHNAQVRVERLLKGGKDG